MLGPEPDRGAPGGFARHRDGEHTAKQILAARRRLGIDPRRGLGPVAEQARRVPELTPPPPELERGRDRGLGFEL